MTENPIPHTTEARLARFLQETGLARQGAKVVPLTGDASDRRYFRVLLRAAPSQVLAVYPDAIHFESLPFVSVARLFAAVPLPSPRILVHSDPLGIIALQDLGDVTLQAHLGTASRSEHAALYRQAVTFIETLQRRGVELASADCPAFATAFDESKFVWELQFFSRHFLEGYRGATLSDASRTALDDEYVRIASELAAEPRVLCHRDYHSRNLMLHDGRLHIIDFQDARMGPDTYDLASLLRDSYVDLSDQQVEELIAFFLALRGGDVDQLEFRRRFDLMALQRNLKALGTFGFQTAARGNPVYIQYIPRTLSYVRANMARHPRFGRLRDLLSGHLEELRS
jgi:aminoglycoside/choline kinase family phosphotransferase